MSEKIIQALKKLDPKVDAHWTKDGQPDMNLLKIFFGGKITKEEATAAWPEFNRELAAKEHEAGQAPTNVASDTPVTGETTGVVSDTPVTPDTNQQVQTTIAADSPAEVDSEPTPEQMLESMLQGLSDDEMMDKLQTFIDELNDDQRIINARRKLVMDSMDKIILKRDAEKRNSPSDANAEYLAAQQKQRQEKADRLKELHESGLTRKALDQLIPKPAPIDQALARKR